eukprot:5833238-Alexandrium_andersonii.AAC.1
MSASRPHLAPQAQFTEELITAVREKCREFCIIATCYQQERTPPPMTSCAARRMSCPCAHAE